MKTEIPLRTVWLCVAAASFCAFLGGRATRIFYMQNINDVDAHTLSVPTNHNHDASPKSANVDSLKEDFPFPVLPNGKKFPQAKYTGMHFSETESDYKNLHLKNMVGQGLDEECFFDDDDGSKLCIIDRTANDTTQHESTYATQGNGDEHRAVGQHLLLDIKNVDSTFLDSEHRLARAMVDLVTESKLTLLSYHCHKLIPRGVSCVGILLESHVSFHTWPDAGVITLDLFTCGSGELVPVVPLVERLFAISKENIEDSKEPETMWWHTFRGFREDHEWGKLEYLSNDLGDDILESASIDYKKEIAWAKTLFQRIDIYDTIPLQMDYDSYQRSLQDDGSYESLYPEFYRPQRTVFLDGIIQSTLKELEAYHEALVHPAMFSHPNPKRVAIIGGGEGATLREVLKHNTIEAVKMIEIDEKMVKVSRESLPEWNSCGDIIGSDVEWCGEDSRVELHYEDAVRWFKDRFSDEYIDSEEFDEDPFDVLIMDALDPQDNITFASILYTDETFIESLYDALTDDGIIVFQLGASPFTLDPADEFTFNARRSDLIDILEEAGFEILRVYEDGHCGFGDPWVFLIAMKSDDNLSGWFQTSAKLEVEIHDRIFRTKSGVPALHYFDSGVMSNYRYPHKAFETVFCRSAPKPKSCYMQNAFHERVRDVPVSDLDVRMSTAGDGSGRGVFTKVDIKKGSTIGRNTHRNPILFNPSATEYVHHYMDISKSFDDVYRYIVGYGWQNDMLGENSYLVDSSILTFVNHGCNATYNIDSIFGSRLRGTKDFITEQNATEEFFIDGDVFDPMSDRRDRGNNEVEVALWDIKAGDELFCNYIFFASGDEDWWTEVTELKNICNGIELGLIAKSEIEVIKEKKE